MDVKCGNSIRWEYRWYHSNLHKYCSTHRIDDLLEHVWAECVALRLLQLLIRYVNCSHVFGVELRAANGIIWLCQTNRLDVETLRMCLAERWYVFGIQMMRSVACYMFHWRTTALYGECNWKTQWIHFRMLHTLVALLNRPEFQDNLIWLSIGCARPDFVRRRSEWHSDQPIENGGVIGLWIGMWMRNWHVASTFESNSISQLRFFSTRIATLATMYGTFQPILLINPSTT